MHTCLICQYGVVGLPGLTFSVKRSKQGNLPVYEMVRHNDNGSIRTKVKGIRGDIEVRID